MGIYWVARGGAHFRFRNTGLGINFFFGGPEIFYPSLI